MKKIIITLFAGFVATLVLPAAVTISGGEFAFDVEEYSAFRNVEITDSSPYQSPAGTPERYALSNMFVGVTDGSQSGMFNDSVGAGNNAFIEFKTASQLQLSEIKLALAMDPAGGRAASAWSLYASATDDGFNAGNLISSGAINPDYTTYPGASNLITITDDLDGGSVTAQYFRLELKHNTNGVRVVELGAKIPEPSQTAAIMGFALLAGVIIGRRCHC